jgi:hypothetical protein
VQRATSQSKTGFDRGYGATENSPVFEAGWSGCMYVYLSLFVPFAHLKFPYLLI